MKSVSSTVKLIFISFIILIFILFQGCKKPDLSTPESTVNGLYESVLSGEEDAWIEFITPDSKELLFKLRQVPGVDADKVTVAPPQYLRWKIESTEINGDRAIITVSLFKSEKQKEAEAVIIKLKRIRGDWLVDIEDELRSDLNEEIL